MKKYTRGFTLIELLVVIAIIGILSSVVLVSLNSARGKGGDAAIQGNLSGIRSQAELWASNNGNVYGPTTAASGCTLAGSVFADATIQNQVSSAVTANGGTAATCVASANAWAVSVPLKSSTNRFCVDSTGIASTTGPTVTISTSDFLCN